MLPEDQIEQFHEIKATWEGNRDDSIHSYNLACCYHWRIGTEPDYKRAFELYTQAYSKGLTEAATNLGILYLEGKGVKQDVLRAAALFIKGAEAGDINAKANLSNIFVSGRYENEIPLNIATATKWVKEAVAAKNPTAIYNLGLCYVTGKLGNKDINKAKALLKEAAALGHPRAEELLAELP